MSSEIVKKDILEEFIKNKDLEQLLKLLEDSETPQVKEKQNSKQRRVSKWFGDKDSFPVEKLIELRRKMSSFVAKKFAAVNVSEPRVLTPSEALALMEEIIDAELIRDALDARHHETKRMVFDSLTAANSAEGISDPEHHNGSIEVPALKKQFTREGTGKTAPTLNPLALRALLTTEEWEEITTVTIIPERREYTIDEKKLAEFLHANPRKIEALRQALIPGKWKTPRFVVRDL